MTAAYARQNRGLSSTVIKFVVETVKVKEGKELKGIKPDADGYFRRFPVAVIGAVSLNSTLYDAVSVQEQITNPTSKINIVLTGGSLYGEWGHPKLTTLKPDATWVRRISQVHEDRISHHIAKIETGDQLANGGYIIYADIKPFGPYKDPMMESLLDPNMNTAFSLRSLCTERLDRSTNIMHRYVRQFVTFDAVTSGGFGEASKRYVGAQESQEFTMRELLSNSVIDGELSPGMETLIRDKDILDVFGAKEMVVQSKVIGTVIPGTDSYLDNSGNLRSIFQAYMDTRRK